jgi:predicted deacylase
VLCQDLLSQADAVFTLHGAEATGVLSPWVEFLDVPGAVGRASYEMARASGFTDLVALPKLPGRLLAAMGEQGVPMIEGEVGGRGTVRPENVAFYLDRVHAVARHVGVLPRDSRPAPAPGDPRIWHLGPQIVAEAGGILVILNARGDVAAEVRAPIDTVIGGYREHVGVRTGETVFTLWTPATGPRAHRTGRL